MRVQRSGPKLTAALEDIWHTLRGTSVPASRMTTSYAAKAARVSTRTMVQVKIDSDAKAAGITATKQTQPTSSASSGRAGLSGSYTRPTTLRPRIAVPTTNSSFYNTRS